MKILLCSHEMTYTGAPRSLFSMLEVLLELGHEVSVWSLKDGPMAGKFLCKGIPVKIVDFPHCVSEQLEEEIKNFNLVIANTAFCAAFENYAQRFTTSVLWLREASNLPQLIRNCGLSRMDIEEARHMVCVSEYARDSIKKNFRLSEIAVIHNYIRDIKYRPICLFTKKIRFIVSGTIEERKQQHLAIEAYKMMPKALQNICELHLVGHRPTWSEHYWKALVDSKEDGVFWHESIKDDALLLELYEQMHVFIIPSVDEACSLVALEGALLGRALILSENVGAKYLMKKNKYIFETRNAGDLCRRMCMLTSRRELIAQGIINHHRAKKLASKGVYKSQMKKYLNTICSSS